MIKYSFKPEINGGPADPEAVEAALMDLVAAGCTEEPRFTIHGEGDNLVAEVHCDLPESDVDILDAYMMTIGMVRVV